jgi:hypothetical protein
MAPKPNYYTLTPPILNKDAPAPLALEVRFDATPSAVKLHFTFNNSDVALTPDASGKVFTTSVPPAALLTNFDDTDVFRHVIGQLQVSLGGEHDQYWISGNVLTAAIPPVSVQPVAADIQFSDHVVNINFPLPDPYSQVTLQLENICKKFFTAFDDEYDFLQLVFVRSYFENRYHGASRNDIKGIGQSQFNNDAQFGSAGRMLGYSVFPYPTGFDAAAPAVLHELGHQWIDYLGFAPFQPSIPHWPISDLAADIMGFSIFINGQPEGGQFNFTLQPVGGGNYKMVPDNTPKKFSDLSLYLMGMRPANQVGPHFSFVNQAQVIAANGILNGPTTPITINDVIAKAGARVPDASTSQKKFRVATILVTTNGLASNETMRFFDFFAARARGAAPVAYCDGLLKGTSLPFKLVTNGAGRLDPRIKRNILVDASRDGGVWWKPQPQQGPFNPAAPHQGKALADHLRSLRHRVRELMPPTAITPALLADWDIVVRVNSFGPYTAAEIAAYDAWVKDGGSLLLLAEFNPQDGLAQHFGLTFKGTTAGQQLLSQFVPHPLTAGVMPLGYQTGSGVTAFPPGAKIVGKLSAASFLDLNNNGVHDPGEPLAPAVLGVLPVGLGRIVFCGDANMWEAVPQPLVKNMLHWFAAATP